eukprot:412384_1
MKKIIKNSNKRKNHKQKGRNKNKYKKQLKTQTKSINTKTKPPDPTKTKSIESPNSIEPPDLFGISDPWSLHQSDPWWTSQLTDAEFKEDYEKQKQLQPNLTIKNYFYKNHQLCGPNILVNAK